MNHPGQSAGKMPAVLQSKQRKGKQRKGKQRELLNVLQDPVAAPRNSSFIFLKQTIPRSYSTTPN
jgi:hypothetical protein